MIIIKNKLFDICIAGGCGHIGLPLSIAFASRGKKVVIYDINLTSIDMIRAGKMPFHEANGEAMLKEALQNGNLTLSTDWKSISQSETSLIAIDTPLDEHQNPSWSKLKTFFEEHIDHFSSDQLIIVRSTLYPGTSEKIYNLLIEKRNDLHLAFCPERILEGKSLEELEKLPQIISSFSEEGIKRSTELFETLTKDIIILSPTEAELMKLYTNAWRYITFAVANRFFMIANDLGVDFYKIYNAMTYNYPRAIGIPRPGFAGGPCLFKDTAQLGSINNTLPYLENAALQINEGLPNYIVHKLSEVYDLSTMTVGILGMAFKGDHDSPTGSLSYKLRKTLELKAKSILCTDPYVCDERLVPLQRVLNESDILIIATPHSLYKNLPITHQTVVDVWNVLGKGALIK